MARGVASRVVRHGCTVAAALVGGVALAGCERGPTSLPPPLASSPEPQPQPTTDAVDAGEPGGFQGTEAPPLPTSLPSTPPPPPECDGVSLFSALDPQVVSGPGGTTTFTLAAPDLAGRYFLSVLPLSPSAKAVVSVDGRQLLGPSDLKDGRLSRVEVSLGATSSLEVRTLGQGSVEVRVDGVVRDDTISPSAWRHVFETTLYTGSFDRGNAQVVVPAPATEGVFWLEVTSDQSTAAAVSWNGAELFGPSDFNPQARGPRAPALLLPTNDLRVGIRGRPTSALELTVSGWAVDDVPPDAAWVAPGEGACVGPTQALSATFLDALSGIHAVQVVVENVDVTRYVQVGDGALTVTLGDLPALVKEDGPKTALLRVVDGACNLTEETLHFTYDATPPELTLTPEEQAVVFTSTPALSAAYVDPTCGVETSTFTATLGREGEPAEDVTGLFVVGPDAASATAPELADGRYVFSAAISDHALNRAQASVTFEVKTTGDVLCLVLDPSGVPVPGARVTTGERELVTDGDGRALFTEVPQGSQALVADGYALGRARVTEAVDVKAGQQVTGTWILPLLAPGAPLTLDADGRTTQPIVITNPAVPGAEVRIAQGSRVLLPEGFTFPSGMTPQLELHQVALVDLPAPLPDGVLPTHVISLQVEGTEIVEGFEVVLPADPTLHVPGDVVPIYQLSADATAWTIVAHGTVSLDGSLVTGQLHSHKRPVFVAGQQQSLPVTVTVAGQVVDGGAGAGVADALIEVNGRETRTASDGTFTLDVLGRLGRDLDVRVTATYPQGTFSATLRTTVVSDRPLHGTTDPSPLELSIQSPSVIRGRVTVDGQPANGVVVGVASGALAPETRTNHRGEFSLSSVRGVLVGPTPQAVVLRARRAFGTPAQPSLYVFSGEVTVPGVQPGAVVDVRSAPIALTGPAPSPGQPAQPGTPGVPNDPIASGDIPPPRVIASVDGSSDELTGLLFHGLEYSVTGHLFTVNIAGFDGVWRVDPGVASFAHWNDLGIPFNSGGGGAQRDPVTLTLQWHTDDPGIPHPRGFVVDGATGNVFVFGVTIPLTGGPVATYGALGNAVSEADSFGGIFVADDGHTGVTRWFYLNEFTGQRGTDPIATTEGRLELDHLTREPGTERYFYAAPLPDGAAITEEVEPVSGEIVGQPWPGDGSRLLWPAFDEFEDGNGGGRNLYGVVDPVAIAPPSGPAGTRVVAKKRTSSPDLAAGDPHFAGLETTIYRSPADFVILGLAFGASTTDETKTSLFVLETSIPVLGAGTARVIELTFDPATVFVGGTYGTPGTPGAAPVPDADGDGLIDAIEALLYGQAPIPDEGDGLTSFEEVVIHDTDPRLADTDGDGWDDDVEVARGSNPTDPANAPGPPPTVLRTSPANTASGVDRDALVLVDFSADLGIASLTSENFTLTQSGVGPLTTFSVVTYSASSRQVRLSSTTPSGLLPANATITLLVRRAVESALGNFMEQDFTASFATSSSVSPRDSDGDGLLDLEEGLLGTNWDPGTGGFDTDGDLISDYDELFVTFTDPLDPDSDGDGVGDGLDATPAGAPGERPRTPLPALGVPFQVVHLAPLGLASSPAEVPADTVITVMFNNPLDLASVNSTNVVLLDQTTGAGVNLAVALPLPSPSTLVLRPTTLLVPGDTYKLVLVGDQLDTGGNGLPFGTYLESYFRVSPPAPEPYEYPQYYSTLALTDWETFPLLAPTASGRMGGAVVVPVTRRLFVTETDVVTPGRDGGLPVAITRVHRNNEDAASGMFGGNWHFAYDASFTAVADQNGDGVLDLAHRTGDGRRFVYTSQGGAAVSTYRSPPGMYDTLKSVVVGGKRLLVQRTKYGVESFYELHLPGNPAVRDPDNLPLNAVGYLVRVRDPSGNQVVFNRAPTNHPTRPDRLESIVDDLDRTTTFTYSATPGQQDLCVEVTQFAGAPVTRSWRYSYDASRRLVRVETPPSDWSDEGAPVTDTRKAREYTYTTSGGVHCLTSVQDGRRNASFRVLYDLNRDVQQVDVGAGSDAGTAVYAWRRTPDGSIDGNRATQVDRNGNVLVVHHVNTAVPGLWTIDNQQVFTRGLHPTLPGGEPEWYRTRFRHDSDGELIEMPSLNVYRWIRDARGNVIQHIRKAATGDELALDPDAKRELDIVVEYAYEPQFNRLIRITEPRGNSGQFVAGGNPIVTATEDVLGQAPRTLSDAAVDAAQRNAYTRFLYHDHERIGARLAEDSAAIRDAVTLVRPLPRSFGRTAPGAYHDPPDPAVFRDGDGDGFLDRGGHLYAVREPRPRALDPLSGAFEAGRQTIERAYTHNQWGQPVLEVQPDGQRNRLEYHLGAFDLAGNPQRGRLRHAVVATAFTDADLDLAEGDPAGPATGVGLDLTASFPAYDVFGNILAATDPRGFTSTRVVNLLNLATRTTAPAPFEYDQELVFDGNNNLVEVRVENVVPVDQDDDGLQGPGEQAPVAAHPWFVHRFAYTSANRLARRDLDAFGSDPAVLTTSFSYDRKQLCAAVREHEGDVHVWRWDERDLLYETVQGANDPRESETTRYEYDPNRNLSRVFDDDGNQAPAFVYAYDTFDRRIRATDELGDAVHTLLDVASLTREQVVTGLPRGDPGDPTTSVLAHALVEYDELGRPFQSSHELWGAEAPLAALGLTRPLPPVDLSGRRVAAGELVSHTAAYSVDSLTLATFDDNGHRTGYSYDLADRLSSVEDALQSRAALTYDPASNVIRVTETERRDDGLPAETYFAERFFDELGRPIATVSHLGNTSRALWDSRGQLVQTSDAMGAVTGATLASLPTAAEHGSFPQLGLSDPQPNPAINQRGNTVRFTYDGVGRPLETIRELRSDGTGAGSLLVGQEVVTRQAWDGNGRLRSRTDPDLNATGYAYDAQSRRVRTLCADGTEQRTHWNRVDTVALEVDARGVTRTYAYDAAERPTACAIANQPQGAGQTTFLGWRRDGLGRLTRAEDDDTITELFHDSLSRQVRETQRIGTGAERTSASQALLNQVVGSVVRAFDGVGNLKRQVYPGGTTIERDHDAVDRLRAVREGAADLATYEHVGMGSRRLSRTYPGSSVRLSRAYDGERRVVRHDHVRQTDGQRLRGFSYAWDRADNRRFERRLLVNTDRFESAGPGDHYRYDSLYRLTHEDRDVASSALDQVQNNLAATFAPTPVTSLATEWSYDPAGNRQQVVSNGVTELYQLRAGLPELDAPMNQYSSVGAAIQTHDSNGNTTSDGSGLQRFFDHGDQLVQWTQAGKDVRYRYDALGRRVSKRTVSGGATWVVYFSDGWQEVEETSATGVVQRRYVYGEGLDEPIRATLPDAADLDGDGDVAELVDLFYHDNSLGSVVALSTAAGQVVESYRYEAFGEASIFDGTGAEVAVTQVGQPFMFTGRRLDWEEGSGLYFYRLRYYDPAIGRFVSRDPLGAWGDAGQMGVGQGYCGNNPISRTDPFGLDQGGQTRIPEERRLAGETAEETAERLAREAEEREFGQVVREGAERYAREAEENALRSAELRAARRSVVGRIIGRRIIGPAGVVLDVAAIAAFISAGIYTIRTLAESKEEYERLDQVQRAFDQQRRELYDELRASGNAIRVHMLDNGGNQYAFGHTVAATAVLINPSDGNQEPMLVVAFSANSVPPLSREKAQELGYTVVRGPRPIVTHVPSVDFPDNPDLNVSIHAEEVILSAVSDGGEYPGWEVVIIAPTSAACDDNNRIKNKQYCRRLVHDRFPNAVFLNPYHGYQGER